MELALIIRRPLPHSSDDVVHLCGVAATFVGVCGSSQRGHSRTRWRTMWFISTGLLPHLSAFISVGLLHHLSAVVVHLGGANPALIGRCGSSRQGCSRTLRRMWFISEGPLPHSSVDVVPLGWPLPHSLADVVHLGEAAPALVGECGSSWRGRSHTRWPMWFISAGSLPHSSADVVHLSGVAPTLIGVHLGRATPAIVIDHLD